MKQHPRITRGIPPAAMGALAFILGACASGPTIGSKATGYAGRSGEVVVEGDWDDVGAAVYGAIQGQEVAVLSERRGMHEHRFELLTIRDEPGWFVAERSPGEGKAGSITLMCSIGHFGDPDRERLMLQRASRRLRELAGVGAAPIRW